MNRLLKSLFIGSIFSVSLYAKEIVNYKISVDYIFDSNISRNISEEGRSYPLPSLDMKLLSPGKFPLYLKGALAFDSYLKEREFDDNSPFVEIGFGTDLKKKKLKFSSEIIGAYYMGFGYETENDEESWKAVIRKALWDNKISYKKKRKTIALNIIGGVDDYGKDVDGIKSDKSGYLFIAEPSFTYKLKKDKDQKIGVKDITLSFEYEYKDCYNRKGDYNRFTIPLSFSFKFLRTDIETELAISKKLYQNEREDDLINKNVTPYYNRITVGTDISIPLISNLSIIAGGKLRYRDSNWRSFDYNRHTCHLQLLWKHKVEN